LYITLLAILTVSCTGLEKADCSKDENRPFPLDRLTFELSVGEPETADTKSAKTGWSKGDKINLWFASNYAQSTPDVVILFDGSSWEKSFVRKECTLPQNGTFAALFESSNSLDSQSATVSGSTSTYNVPASTVTGGSFNCSPMLMSAINLCYTIDSKTEVLSASISGW